ncbi:MAG: DUF6505 family protein [Halofilum sp. (in: g-proteobacteria)]|nr:DUF6505 family protein [Halofilum sp. (in: g-proteobacteria)]
MRLLRILRLDDSDTEVYFPAARAGEPAVPGTFMFTFNDVDPERLGGSEAEAFRRGFLGLETLGWGTLVTVAEVSEAERRAAVDRLTAVFIDRFGAPDEAAARAQAEEELAFVDSLCEQPVNTILSLQRSVGEEEVEEQFHTHTQQADWEAPQYPVFRITPEGEG